MNFLFVDFDPALQKPLYIHKEIRYFTANIFTGHIMCIWHIKTPSTAQIVAVTVFFFVVIFPTLSFFVSHMSPKWSISFSDRYFNSIELKMIHTHSQQIYTSSWKMALLCKFEILKWIYMEIYCVCMMNKNVRMRLEFEINIWSRIEWRTVRFILSFSSTHATYDVIYITNAPQQPSHFILFFFSPLRPKIARTIHIWIWLWRSTLRDIDSNV